MGTKASRTIDLTRWRRFLLPCACLLALSLAVITSASAERSASTAKQADFGSKQLNELLNKPLMVRAELAKRGMPAGILDAKIASQLAAAKRRQKTPMVKPFIVFTAVDGDQLYTVQTTQTLPWWMRFFSAIQPMPLKIVRTQISTGAKDTLYKGTQSAIYSVSARNGRFAVSVVRPEAGRRSFVVATQILATEGPTAPLKSIDSQSARARGESALCGTIDLLSSISDGGEILANRIEGQCLKNGDNLFHTSFVGYTLDSSFRTLRAPGGTNPFEANASQLVGTKLIGPNLQARGIEIYDVMTGQVTPVWAGPRPFTSDVAADGSIALAAGQSESGGYFTGDYYGSGASNGVVLAPIRERSTQPMVMFPQADANSPKQILPFAGDFTVKYCGSTLYAVRTIRKRLSFRKYFMDPFALLLSDAARTVKLRVAVVDPVSAQLRTVATTKRMIVTSFGCSGESLAIAQGKTVKQGVLRYGP